MDLPSGVTTDGSEPRNRTILFRLAERPHLGIASATEGRVTSADKPEPTGKERRRFSRVALDVAVRLRVPDADGHQESRIRDVSLNGVFIITNHTKPLGTNLKLAIEVGTTGMVMTADGLVVHEVTTADASESRPAGMGVMFVSVADESKEALEKLMSMGKPI